MPCGFLARLVRLHVSHDLAAQHPSAEVVLVVSPIRSGCAQRGDKLVGEHRIIGAVTEEDLPLCHADAGPRRYKQTVALMEQQQPELDSCNQGSAMMQRSHWSEVKLALRVG